MLRVHLQRMCNLQMLVIMFYKCHLDQGMLIILFRSSISLMLFLCSCSISFWKRCKSIFNCGCGIPSPFSSINFCPIYYVDLLLHTYMFLVVRYSWWIHHFMIMNASLISDTMLWSLLCLILTQSFKFSYVYCLHCVSLPVLLLSIYLHSFI